MKIKMPKPTKAEMIRTFFNQWDPLGYVDKAGFMYYNYEAEELAQRIRKTSKPETISLHIQELMKFKAQLENKDVAIKADECNQIAMLIHTWMKRQ